MSRDLQLAWACPHLTLEEHVSLAADRQTLPTRQPVGAEGTVRILVNDSYFLPQGGLFSTAQLSTSTSGPYDLTEGEDELTIEAPGGDVTFSFGVTGLTRLSTNQVVQRIQQETTIVLPENLNGHLVLSDTETVGPDSFVRVRGSAATALGYGDTLGANNRTRGARGKQLFPGWKLHVREDTITNRYPKFDERVRNNPVFKVTYTVPGRRCLRCGGTFVENDLRFDSTGQGITIANENLLYQAVLKILLTDQGSNPYHVWYGTNIRSRIGSKAIGAVASLISEDVRQALRRLQTVQQEQAKYQQVTAKETLYAVLGVDVYPHTQDQTTFLVDVTAQNAAAEAVALSIVYTVPEVVALLGSNGLYLGTDAVGLEREQQLRLFPGGRTILPVEG